MRGSIYYLDMNQTHPKFVRWAVMLGIVIALNLFFFAARALVLPEPQFEDYCPHRPQVAETQQACEREQGVWVNTPADAGAPKTEATGYCDYYQTCQPVYDEAHEKYQMYAFVTMVGLGVLSLVLGVIPMGSSIVSTGLSYGGVLALIIGAAGYWDDAGNLLRLAMSVIALGALIYIGIRRFQD